MSLPSINRRKSSNVTNLEKNKYSAKHNETKSRTHNTSGAHEYMETVKKSDAPVSMKNVQRKSDTDKSLHADAQEKASGEPYVHEFKEFAGVTIILRTIPNPKALANLEGHGKASMYGSRRKSEFQHSLLNMQDKFDHGEKTDHTGPSLLVSAAKSDVSTNNSNETSGGDN